MFKIKNFILVFTFLLILSGNSLSADIEIETDRNFYTPILSSTIGIGLTPKHPLENQKGALRFHWSTNFGAFFSWNNGVRGFGPEVTNNGDKIFWSYDPREMGKIKPPVRISLRIEDEKTKNILGETCIEIEWDKDFAKVKK